MNNRLGPTGRAEEWLATLCAHHVGVGPATLLLYDATTLSVPPDLRMTRFHGHH